MVRATCLLSAQTGRGKGLISCRLLVYPSASVPRPLCRHSLHAIASQLSPAPGCGGIELLQAETFDLHCLQVGHRGVAVT